MYKKVFKVNIKVKFIFPLAPRKTKCLLPCNLLISPIICYISIIFHHIISHHQQQLVNFSEYYFPGCTIALFPVNWNLFMAN